MTPIFPLAARLWLAILLFSAVPAAAQTASTESRAAEHARQQEEKAKNTSPYRRVFFEQKLAEIEQAGGFSVVRGWFVTFGDIKQGAGVALGPAYGKLFDNGAVVIGKVTYSIRNFKLAQVYAAAPPMANGRVQISGRVRWQDAPSLAVFALGPDSPNTRADYSETRTEVSAQAALRPVRLLRFGLGGAFERYHTGGAGSARRPSVETLYTPAQMPGLAADPEYLHTFVSAAIDSRRGLGYSRSGTLLEATLHDYRDNADGPYSFRRLDSIARQQIPILHGNWVIDLSVRASSTTTDDGNVVPFFLLPDLGGSSDLRGYGAYRFRDRHSIIFTGEYRWYVQEFVDMALFYDAGKVAPRRGDLNVDDLKSNVGIGIRFHGPQTTALRIELARGDEGTRFIFAFSAPVR